MNKKVPIPISGGLILSYKCSAKCQHCIYACSPEWEAHWISEEDLEKILSNLAGKIKPGPFGPDAIDLSHGLHFTGGEPFLNFELLCKATEIANKLDIPSIFVETNCYWCVDDKVTREKLQILKEKGLKGIMISVNPFYLEYVPFERTERAVKISYEIFGNNLAVYQLEYYRRFKEFGIKDKLSLNDYLKIEKKEIFDQDVEFLIMGRAPYKLKNRLEKTFQRLQAKYFLNEPCSPSFLRSWHNHFDNYGNYVPGYCAGISFGDCRKLDKLLAEGLNTEESPVLKFLVDEDFEGLLGFAKNFDFKESNEGYFSKCHLCMDIRKYLVSKQDFKELTPKEFYFHLENRNSPHF